MSPYALIARNLNQAFRKAPVRNNAPSPAFVRYLEIIYTPEEARILAQMKGYPGFMTTRRIAGATGDSCSKVEAILFKVLEKNGVTRMGNAWCIPAMPLLLNLAAGLSNAGFDARKAGLLHHEFFVEDEYYKRYETSEAGTPSLRSIPIEKSILPGEKILSGEEAHDLINTLNHDDLLLAPCPCRTRQEALDRRQCKDKNPVGSCIFLGVSALQLESAGVGERVSKAQAIAYFDRMHAMGLVGATDNMVRDNIIICLCCGCCCSHLGGRTRWDNPAAMAPSNFIPSPSDSCMGCGKCARHCWLSAIRVSPKEKRFELDTSKCIGCGACTQFCPTRSLKMKRMDRTRIFPSQDALYKTLAKENNRSYL